MAVGGGFAPVRAATVWSEAIQGDLSGNRLVPSVVVLAPGDNDVIATTGSGDQEYFRITVPPLGQLTGMVLKSYSGFDGTAFIGAQQGTTFTVDPFSAQPSNLYGYTHFGTNLGQVNTNILDDIASGPGAQGFTPPLGPGNYTFWIQQLGSAATYDLNFQLTVVPEPAAVIVLALVCAGGLARRRRGC
jgi:hypothetical protein